MIKTIVCYKCGKVHENILTTTGKIKCISCGSWTDFELKNNKMCSKCGKEIIGINEICTGKEHYHIDCYP